MRNSKVLSYYLDYRIIVLLEIILKKSKNTKRLVINYRRGCLLKEKKKETQNKPAKTECWKYDDCSGQSVQKEKKRVVRVKALSKEKYEDSKHDAISKKERIIESGIYNRKSRIDLLEGYSDDVEDLKAGFDSLTQLIADYTLTGNSKEMMRLFSLILMGYTTRLFLQYAYNPMLLSTRAPVICVQRDKYEFTGGFEHLSYIVQCFAVDTSLDGKLRHYNPAVLPNAYFTERIDECAYLSVKGDKSKMKFPAQYRDTIVLLHTKFFKNSDIEKFVNRNPWGSILLFDQKSLDKQAAEIKLDMNCLNLSQKDWDTMDSIKNQLQIQELIHYFVYWLSEIYITWDVKVRARYWLRFGIDAVQKYNYACLHTQQETVQGSKKRYLWLQAASLRLFLDFCAQEEIIDDLQRESLWNDWCNGLLPGSRDRQIYQESEEKRQQEEEKERKCTFELYEKLLKSFIESADNSMFIQRKGLKENLDEKIYYRNRGSIIVGDFRRNKKDKFRCVILLRKDMDMFAQERNPAYIKVITNMWGAKYSEEEYPPYIHTNNNVTLWKDNSPHAVVLRAEELRFLKEDVYKRIMEMNIS